MVGNCEVTAVREVEYINSPGKRLVWTVLADNKLVYSIDSVHVIGNPKVSERANLSYEETDYGMAYFLREIK